MAKLLYIEASPRKERSYSIQTAKAFLEAYKGTHPADTVEKIDLWTEDLPPFDGDIIDAKYAVIHNEKHTAAQAAAWERVKAVFGRFNAADKYLFSVPMWNLSIPYLLKHYIDVITQPGLSFSFSPEGGYIGLVTGRPAVVIYSSASDHREGSGSEALDFQKPYFESWLRLIGFTEIHRIVVSPTLGMSEQVQAVSFTALQAAVKCAKEF